MANAKNVKRDIHVQAVSGHDDLECIIPTEMVKYTANVSRW